MKTTKKKKNVKRDGNKEYNQMQSEMFSTHILVGIEWKIHLKRQLTEMASLER